MEMDRMERRLQAVERRLRITQAYALISTILVFLALGSFRPSGADEKRDSIIRTRGIVVVDEKGRERILIGAPIPPAKNRVRTDLKRVKETWAKRFPAKYMDYYKGYSHSANGMLILDENGFDRVAVGDPSPDPNIGKRIGPSSGIIINDDQGFERAGFGLIKADGVNRVGLGLDTNKGREGLSLMVHDDGGTGVLIGDPKRGIFLGDAPANHWATGLKEPFLGMKVQEGDGKAGIYGTVARP